MMKKVTVNATLGDKFRIESTIGNHALVVDQVATGGGDDGGPSPLEYLFLSLGGCIATIARIVAMQQRINLRGVEVSVEGDLDINFLLGATQEGRCGFTGITVKTRIDADMTREEKEAFLHQVDARCPVSENLLNATPVSVILDEG